MRPIFTAMLLFSGACGGGINCGGCFGGALTPIPGGFDESARIERAAQVRMTQRGLDQIGTDFQDLMTAYSSMACGTPADVPCPTNFVTPQGAPNPATCQAGVCVEQASGQPGPLLGFEFGQTTSGNATICRDDPAQPGARRCFAWIRFEALSVTPMGPNQVLADITVQIETNDIPFRYDALGGMDCIMSVSSVPNTQDLRITAALSRYNPPVGNGGQLQVDILDVSGMIPDNYVSVASDPDPRYNDGRLLCAIADLGFVKQILIGQLTDQLATIIGDEVDKALGMQCLFNADCPAQTTCNSDNVCEETASGRVVPSVLGMEGRLDFSQLLAGFLSGRPGRGDIAFVVGGDSSADGAGVNIGALGGAEVVNPDTACAPLTPSPRLRPGFVVPPELPTDALVDLDFDGTPETQYMAAAGLSQALMDQFMWTIYSTGLFCTGLSSYDIDLLNTGSLGLLISSLDQLTHADKFPEAIFPARVSIRPGAEPRLTIGSGEVMGGSSMPMLVDPLLTMQLNDFEATFYAQIEERWVRLMTVTLDLALGFGAMVNANNELQLVIGDLENAVSNVRVTNSEILAEDPAELEQSIPSLLGIALPGFTGVLPPIALPTAAELGGFDLTVLGVRGVDTNGTYDNMAVYADLAFDASQAGNLSASADTVAAIETIAVPSVEAFAVSAAGGPTSPTIVVSLGGTAPGGGKLEHQIRVDGGLWSPFFTNDHIELSRPEFLAQGHHSIEVRAREVGAYKTLDPSPVLLDVVIDPEPPRLVARLNRSRGGVVVRAHDVVSGDAVRVELIVDGEAREVAQTADGFIELDAVNLGASIEVRATDEAGNVATRKLYERVVTSGPAASVVSDAVGCRCVEAERGGFAGLLLVFVAGALVRRRR